MLYVSRSKTENIINFYKKGILESLNIKNFNISAEVDKPIKAGVNGMFSFEYKETIETAIKILKKNGNYLKKLDTPINLGVYYDVEGNLVYKRYINGRTRDMTEKKFIKRLKDSEFFDNDMLEFQVEINDFPYLIIMDCKAENFECFSQEDFQGHILFSPNTSDPGILYRKIPVKALIRVDCVDDEHKIIMGNPLCIKRRTVK